MNDESGYDAFAINGEPCTREQFEAVAGAEYIALKAGMREPAPKPRRERTEDDDAYDADEVYGYIMNGKTLLEKDHVMIRKALDKSIEVNPFGGIMLYPKKLIEMLSAAGYTVVR